MLRRFVLTAAVAASFAVAAAAAPYSDREKGFTVQVPEGWVEQPGGEYPLDLTLTSPRSDATGGLCLLMSQDVKTTKNMKQPELNELIRNAAKEEFWRAVLTTDKTIQFKDMKLEVKHETRDDRVASRATVFATAVYEGETLQLLLEMMLQAVPGNSYMTQCAVKQDQVALEAADVKTVIDTHTPTGKAGIIASAGQPSGATPVAAPQPFPAGASDAFKTGLGKLLQRLAKPR
jgi:hypothetical protein